MAAASAEVAAHRHGIFQAMSQRERRSQGYSKGGPSPMVL